ncbi:MAG: helical backbone metal receptor [bacterium]|jgi:iron complex transport system substrate-binding protein
MSCRVRIAVARRFLAGILPVLLLLASTPGSRAFAAERFPLALTDDRGVTVRLAAPPRRIVSLAPSLTEIVFLLGREGSLAGVTRFCNYPPAASSLPKIGGVSDPDVERIVALSPDLVLCTTDGNPRDKVRAVEEMGIPCFAVAPQDLDAVFTSIERLGVLLGAADRGRTEAGALRRRARLARPSSPDAEKPAVLFVVSTSPIIAAGKGTFMDELVRLAGGRNAAAGFSGRYPRLSVEELVAARPDVIFVAGMAGVERFPPEVTRWKEVPAFRDGAVITLDGDLVTRPGPRLVTALERVSAALAGWRRSRTKSPAAGAGGKR